MKFRISVLVALAAALLLPGAPVLAEKADRNKPMNIEADALKYDDLKQTSVFTGAVVVTKGTIIIRGARVDVRQDAEGYQFGVVTPEPGKRAFYRQKREGEGDQWIEGEGESIEYDGKADRVKFIRRAEMRRYNGATLNDEVNGNLITVDNTTGMYTVDGAPAPVAGSGGGRIRAMLTPRDAASAPSGAASGPALAAVAAAAASAARAAASQSVPRLRSTLTIGGETK
jgi:lipopolysaccharide export system protein LptA